MPLIPVTKYCQDRDGVRIYLEYCTVIYITNFIYNTKKWNDDEIPQQQQRSNTSYHSESLTATTRLLASTVSQPAVIPTTCHVICWPPYMAWKRSVMTKYGVQSIRRSITWHHVTSRAQMQPSVTPMSVLYMQHAASHGSSLTHIRDKYEPANQLTSCIVCLL